MEDNNRINEENPVMIHGKPVQVGSFDEYHFCMPDTRYFDVADVLVLELSFACVVIKNVGMRGEDKLYKMIDGKKVPISELDFMEGRREDLQSPDGSGSEVHRQADFVRRQGKRADAVRSYRHVRMHADRSGGHKSGRQKEGRIRERI